MTAGIVSKVMWNEKTRLQSTTSNGQAHDWTGVFFGDDAQGSYLKGILWNNQHPVNKAVDKMNFYLCEKQYLNY